MRALLAIMLCCIAHAAFAFELPALYRVVGVASDDVLNVRDGPSTQSSIIGALRHNQRDVEIVDIEAEQKWGLLNIDGRTGWVSLRFMARQDRPTLPLRLLCEGQRPNWAMSLDGDAVFRRNGDETYLGTIATTESTNRANRFALTSKSVSGALTAHVDVTLCADQSTNMLFGITVDALVNSENGLEYYSGCCTLIP